MANKANEIVRLQNVLEEMKDQYYAALTPKDKHLVERMMKIVEGKIRYLQYGFSGPR